MYKNQKFQHQPALNDKDSGMQDRFEALHAQRQLCIQIKGLKCQAVVGVYPLERLCKQDLLLDLEIALKSNVACESDCLQDTIDYAQLAENVRQLVENSEFQLLETLVQAVNQHVLTYETVAWSHVHICKPKVLEFVDSIGVSLKSQVITSTRNS